MEALGLRLIYYPFLIFRLWLLPEKKKINFTKQIWVKIRYLLKKMVTQATLNVALRSIIPNWMALVVLNYLEHRPEVDASD